ncbi:MAG: 60S ribosomal protein L22 [Candidatus Odinarchaeia archaeon]
MSEDKSVLVIDCGELATVENNLLSQLANFLNEKIEGVNASVDGDDVLVDVSQGKISKTKLRMFIKKFLHASKLGDTLRVSSEGGKTNKLKVQKRRNIKE